MINNATGTIIAMTHILLPFMILPIFSVMKTISPSYVRAAQALGANDWTAFWRVYFPQTVPGHRRRRRSSSSSWRSATTSRPSWSAAPPASSSPTASPTTSPPRSTGAWPRRWRRSCWSVVLALYWLYDRIVGIDNVKLG